jgi:PAS domain S-box-containing protein
MLQDQRTVSEILTLLRFKPVGMTISELSRKSRINRHSIAKYLEILQIAGRVEMKTIGNAKVYQLTRRVPLSSFMNFTEDFIVILDKDLQIVQINDRLLNFAGATKDDILGKRIDKARLPIVTLPEILSAIEKRTEKEQTVADVRDERGGSPLHFRAKILQTVFDDGEEGVTVILEEITEQKEAQIALQRGEQRFRDVADLSPYPIAIIDQDGRYLYINQKFTGVFGYTLDDIPSGREWFIHAFPDPEYRDQVIAAWNDDLRRSRVGEVRQREFRTRSKNGEVKDIIYRPVTLSDGNQYITYEDVTEIRQANRVLVAEHHMMRDIIDFLPDPTFVIDQEKRVIAWNRAMEKLTGVSRDAIVGSGNYAYAMPFYMMSRPVLIDLVDTEDREIEARYPTFRREGQTVTGEGHLTLRNGTRRYYQGKASPLFDQQGNRLGAIQSIRDITPQECSDQ